MSERKFSVIDPPERSRVYVYESGQELLVEGVTGIHVSESGNHYLNTKIGRKVIIAPGWIAIELDIDEWAY